MGDDNAAVQVDAEGYVVEMPDIPPPILPHVTTLANVAAVLRPPHIAR